MNYFFNKYSARMNRLIPTDIYPVQYGEEQCTPSHDAGPYIRSNFLIHYVYNGTGILIVNNTEYRVRPGQLFLIRANQLAYYKADSKNPWLYRWIEFNGSMSDQILSIFDSPILTDDTDNIIGNALLELVKNGDMRFERLMQKFWAFIASLTKNLNSSYETRSEEYVRLAELYIKSNIHVKSPVNKIALHIGINRSYLSRLFKKYKNVSIQEYIIQLKMQLAAQYLQNTDISITETAQSVGYDDYHVFYKAFKKHFNMPPSDWQKNQHSGIIFAPNDK
jgi:AraC-like DNA-binding protein